MKKNYPLITALSVLSAAFTLCFTGQDKPVIGYVQITSQKSGRLKGNPGSPEWDINITSFTYDEEDKAHNVQPSVKFSKPLDATSGELQALSPQENLSTVKFQLFNMQGKKQVVYETVELTNVTIKQIDQNAPNETISLKFQKIKTSYN